MKKYIILAACLIALAAGGCSSGSSTSGWQQRSDGMYYLDETGAPVSGWLNIDGNRYYFQDTGLMSTGWQEIEEEFYYFGEDGAMVTGWQEINGNRYYFRELGSRITGWLSVLDRKYYLTESGAATGTAQISGTTYLFDAEGALASGWTEVGGKRYYGDANSHPLTGWQEIDGVRYCFGDDGAQIIGWIEAGGYSYYYMEDGSPARGYVIIDGETRCFASGGQEILLVNPWNPVPEDYTVELMDIDVNHQIASWAYEDYLEMISDCKAAGLNPAVCSAYRTYEYQETLYTRKVQYWRSQGLTDEEAAAKAGTSVAVPGTSEHQLGLALDLIDNANWKLDESQAKTATQQWLMEHSWEYGWILRYPEGTSESTGIIYEPWHYRYVGREVAADIHETGLCLEDYLDALTANG